MAHRELRQCVEVTTGVQGRDGAESIRFVPGEPWVMRGIRLGKVRGQDIGQGLESFQFVGGEGVF